MPSMLERIESSCRQMNLNESFVCILLLTMLHNIPLGASREAIERAIGNFKAGTADFRFTMILKIIQRVRLGFNTGGNVKVMDWIDFAPSNISTAALYQVLPFIGYKNYYVYNRVADEDGNIVEVKRVLDKRAPYGAFLFWKLARKYDKRLVNRRTY